MKVLIAGGGTAGHINPGIAIAKYIREKVSDVEILFVGTQKGLETKLVPREGFKLKLITVRGFRRKLSFDTILSVKELFQGVLEARKIIKKFKPDIVIGTGGYVCGPVVFIASRMKIPTLIHEQNAFPGVTNRLLSRFTDAVAISFEESRKYFTSAKNLTLTGNPIRSEMIKASRVTAREKLGIEKDQSVVVIFGGSRGAERINSSTVEMLLNYFKGNECKIIFATGDAQYKNNSEKLQGVKCRNLEVVPYIYDMGDVMACSDLVICRAGAITISELTALGVPSIMIPSPYVTANHQEHNARALEAQGAAVVILEKDLDGKMIYDQMVKLLDNKQHLNLMAKSAKNAGITNATEKIYSIIENVINQRKK